MPRFFFDIADGMAVTQDEEGLDLPDLDRAKTEALAVLPDILRETRSQGCVAPRSVTSIVRTETGQQVFQATLSVQSRDLS